MRDWNFETDGPVFLKGEWEFYWQQLFSSSATAPDSAHYINVPGIWNGYLVNERELPGDGYATYRLQVLLNLDSATSPYHPPKDVSTVFLDSSETNLGQRKCQALGFKFGFLQTAYNLYINNRLVATVGSVGKTPATAEPGYRPHVAQYVACESKLDLVVQISNFSHRKGGLEKAIALGKSYQLIDEWENRRNFDLFLLGTILIMAVYHLGLFALRRQNRSPLYFSVFCFLIGIRSIVVGQYFIYEMFPTIPWNLLISIEYLSFFLPFPVMALFIKSLFPEDFPDWFLKAILFISGALTLPIVGSPKLFTHFSTPYQGFLVIAGLIMAVFLIRIAWLNREGSRPLLAGMLALFITMLNDILYNQRIISSSMLFPFGLFIYIFAQSFVLSLRFSKAFTEVEVLSERLERRNQRLLELDRLKDEFITNTSHELRTPLTGIIGIAESMLDGAVEKMSPAAEKNLLLIVTSGKRLANLVNDIIDFSKLKHSDITLSQRPISLRAFAEMIVAFFSAVLGHKQITLRNNVSEELPYVFADEDRLHQIMMNLVGNAIKFTEIGEIAINAKVADNFVELSVSDTGIGIPFDRQNAIFDSFEQANGSISREYGGSGLGLAVTKKLVELHGGTITVVSNEGHGSVFTFSLPIDDGQNPSDLTPSILVSDQLSRSIDSMRELADDDILKKSTDISDSTTILIVDDELVNIQVLHNQLSMHNYGVISATNGFEALEKVEKEKPDLIILDLMMPRMSGYEFCLTIRESYSAAELPIIILTAKNRVGDLTEGLNCGANDYIAKPFAKAELLSRIENQLTLQKYAQELMRLNLNLEIINQSLEKRVSERTFELSEKNDQMKQFLHILCHDLLNPFSSLNSVMEILKTNPENFNELSGYINTAINNGIAIIEMVSKMKDLDKEKISSEIQKHPLLELIQESERIFTQKLKKKQLSLQVEVDNQLYVLVEKTSFVNSVLNNILSNAIKFSFPGSTIKIHSSCSESQVLLTIRDYGIGMPESIIDDLYDLNKSTSRKGTVGEKGTGFGMPLVKSFVSAYGGSIAISSHEHKTPDEEKGTEVCLILNRA